MIGQVRLGRTVLAKHRAPAWLPGIGTFDNIGIQMRTTSGNACCPVNCDTSEPMLSPWRRTWL